MRMKFTLTLSPDYVSHWGLWEAVRELLQNSIDLQNQDAKNKVIFQYELATETLIIGNEYGPKLEPKTLLLGHTTKKNDDDAIGQFGEGYKLALLVLCRMQYDVEVLTDDHKWTPAIDYSHEFQSMLLEINTENTNECVRGARFIIKGVSYSDYDMLTQKYLPNAERNTLLPRKGDVFVEGLFVCHHDKLDHGYNFAANQITLDRDRRMVTDFELSYETSRIWSHGRPTSSLYSLLARGSLDVSYASVSAMQAKDILELFKKEHGNAIPVSSNADVAGVQGSKFAIVPEALKKILWAVGGFVMKRIGTPKQRLNAWLKSNAHQLTDEARSELQGILEDMQ